jgi:AcrR family transcriptional regulator
MTPRPYDLGRRAQAMDERRARVIAAARHELLASPRFTLEAVAERSGVSRVTVYAQFGDRDTLLEAVYDDLGMSGGLDRIPEAFAAPDLAAALRIIVEVFCHFYTVHREVIRHLNALRVLSAGEFAGHGGRNERRREILVTLLVRAGMENDRLVDTLHALTGFAFVDELSGPNRAPDEICGEVAALVVAAMNAAPFSPRGARTVGVDRHERAEHSKPADTG